MAAPAGDVLTLPEPPPGTLAICPGAASVARASGLSPPCRRGNIPAWRQWPQPISTRYGRSSAASLGARHGDRPSRWNRARPARSGVRVGGHQALERPGQPTISLALEERGGTAPPALPLVHLHARHHRPQAHWSRSDGRMPRADTSSHPKAPGFRTSADDDTSRSAPSHQAQRLRHIFGHTVLEVLPFVVDRAFGDAIDEVIKDYQRSRQVRTKIDRTARSTGTSIAAGGQEGFHQSRTQQCSTVAAQNVDRAA